METYLIQQAHVGKLHFANINTELHSLAWGKRAELSRAVQGAVTSVQPLQTEELRASQCFNPPLWICCFTPIEKTSPLETALQVLLFENNIKTWSILPEPISMGF